MAREVLLPYPCNPQDSKFGDYSGKDFVRGQAVIFSDHQGEDIALFRDLYKARIEGGVGIVHSIDEIIQIPGASTVRVIDEVRGPIYHP
jgi:hypothetical protein